MSKRSYSAPHNNGHANNHTGNGYHQGLNIRRQVEGTTDNQKAYIEAIRTSDVTFCEGIAGTGKTFIAVGMAVHLLMNDDKKKNNRIKRLIISRPIVPAGGEDIGFLPGDLHEKTDPYMQPIYESIRKFCRDDAEYKKITDRNGNDPLLEVCPLAFMRGRTFDDAFVILDEAQNCTPEQMKMFLSRMGKNCKVVVTGDLTQSDMDEDMDNGLTTALLRLEGKEFQQGKVSVCYMDAGDIMRNDLIAEILFALRDDDDDEDEDGGDEDEGNDDGDSDDPDDGEKRRKKQLEEVRHNKARKIISNRISPYYADKRETLNGEEVDGREFGAGL